MDSAILIRRAAALGAFHHCDHAIEEAFAFAAGDAHQDPVGAAPACRPLPKRSRRRPSRSTGADSPVTALSFTDATPSMISPSAGMMSPVSTEHHVAFAQGARLAGLILALLVAEQFLGVHVAPHRTQRRCLRLAAALGDGFGEVCEQHRQPQPDRDGDDEARAAFVADLTERGADPMIVVRMLPTNTTNITGLRICTRGSSLRKDSQIAERTICPRHERRLRPGCQASTGANPAMGFA
jgi:hypothetical protein